MSGRDLVFVGDVHLDRDDPDLEAFVEFLGRLGETAGRVILMGDLFNLWIGRPELEQPHQTRVLAALSDLRRRGVGVRYVEGNRDYRIGDGYAGSALEGVASGGIEEHVAGRRIWAVHGDLVNTADRRYRAWRRLSRSALFWGLFNLLPRGRRLRFAESLEIRMRSSNLGFKRELPEAAIRAYATPYFEQGFDAVVLGHFHVETSLVTEAGRGGRVFVLPLWKDGRRYLRVDPQGEISFVGDK